MQNYHLRSTRFFSEKTLLSAVAISSIIGMILSAYLIYLHYTGSSSFCDIDEFWSCYIVNTSKYSEIFGIPVALIGFVGFLLIFALAYLRSEYPKEKNEKFVGYIFYLAILGTAFGTYLTYIELFVLHAICLLCVVSFSMMVVTLILTAVFFLRLGKNLPPLSK